MPRNNKKYSVPHHATAASNEPNATTAAPTVSHSTQSDDEGNVIVELEIQSHADENNSGSGVHEIPEEVELETNTNNTNDPRSEHLADIALLSTPELHESDAAAAAEAASAPDSASIPPNDATPPHATAPTPTPTPTTTSTVAEDVNVDSAPPKSGFFRSICRCFKGMCSLMCFSCCCCRRRRRGSVEIPNET